MKKNVCMCVYIHTHTHTHTHTQLNHFAVHLKRNQLYFNLKKKSYYMPGPKLNPVNNYLIESSQATM